MNSTASESCISGYSHTLNSGAGSSAQVMWN